MSKELRDYEKDVRKDFRDQVIHLGAVMHSPEFKEIKETLGSMDHFDRDPSALGIWISKEAVRRKRIQTIIEE
jgi:hypothetical protein